MKSKKTIKHIISASILAIITLFFITTSLAAEGTATITVETARLRQEASETSTILELVSIGEQVEVLGQEGDWYRVQYNGITGYLRSDLLQLENAGTTEETGTTENTQSQTNEDTVNVSTEPENTENTQNTTQEQPSETTNTEPNSPEAEQNTQEAEQTENQSENTQNEENAEAIDLTGTYTFIQNTEIKITPLINSLSIKTANAGENVQIIDIVNNWVLVSGDGTQGWVRLDQLNKVEENTEATSEETTTQDGTEPEQTEEPAQEESIVPQTKTMYINSGTVNLRSEASQTSEVLAQLTLNTQVTVIQEENGWSRVIVNGTQGYISSNLLSETQQATSRGSTESRLNNSTQSEENNQTENTQNSQNETNTSNETSNSSKGSEVLSYAMQFIGYPYVYGGSSTSGFDCSGFTSYVYKHFGITLNRTAAGQYSNGVKVSRSNLQAGDLIMFGSPINHVGIYAGGGRIVHAANPSRGITTDTINSGYYNTHYVGAVRIFK